MTHDEARIRERREEERSRAKIQRAECRPLRASSRGTRARNLDASPHFLRSPSCRFPLAIPLVFFSFRILAFISLAAHWPTIFDGNFLTVEYFSSAISNFSFFFLYLDQIYSDFPLSSNDPRFIKFTSVEKIVPT